MAMILERPWLWAGNNEELEQDDAANAMTSRV